MKYTSLEKKKESDIFFLEKIADCSESDIFFDNPVAYAKKHGITLSREVLTILNNPVLFDCVLPSGYEEFWMDDVDIIHPIIYKADPTISAAFAFGIIAGKVVGAAAVGAAAAGGARLVTKK